MRFLFLVIFGLSFASLFAHAEEVRYFEDPVFRPLNKDEPMPMEDIIALAQEGDAQAQFIMGDLYSKGKGGFRKNNKKAGAWFEAAARSGYYAAFWRLAALAKRQDDYVAAYKWYSLAIEQFGFGKEASWALKSRKKLIENKKLSDDDIEQARKDISRWETEKNVPLPEEEFTVKIKKVAAETKTDNSQPVQEEKKNEQN